VLDHAERAEHSDDEAPRDDRSLGAQVRDGLETLLVAVLVVLFVSTFAVQNSVIPTASMEETLLVGDHVLVNRVVFAPEDALAPAGWLAQRAVRHGDVVVFKFPTDPGTDYIKRVVGLPGDVVEIRDKQVWRNGEPIVEPYAVHATGIVEPRAPGKRGGQRDNFGPLTVPEAAYFVLGDNRDYSADSREWGCVPRSHVTGRALLVLWSREQRPGTWRSGPAARVAAFLRTLRDFPRDTRWSRVGRLVE
jgi:signal peptidase I